MDRETQRPGPVTGHRGEPGAGAPPRRRGRRALAAALVLAVAGAALVLLAAGRTWAKGRTDAAEAGRSALELTASGRDVTAVPPALALVGLAALLAVFAVRRAGRVAVSVLLALSGAGVVASGVLGVTGGEALDQAAAEATGLSGAATTGVSYTVWPWVAVTGGLLLAAAGVAALARGRHWPGMSARYEAPSARSAPSAGTGADTERPEEMWKALDRGEDPTDR